MHSAMAQRSCCAQVTSAPPTACIGSGRGIACHIHPAALRRQHHRRQHSARALSDRYTHPHLEPQEPDSEVPSAAAQALTGGTLGIGFSAGGLLFPYFAGVIDVLRRKGVLTDTTPVAGASAGSLVAACCKAGLTHEQLVHATLELAADCRRLGTRHNLGPVLSKYLDKLMPSDVHERANACNVHVAVTRVQPRIEPLLINRYDSRQDFIEALMTSCHIPWYFDGNLLTTFRGLPHCDGGLTNFLPSPTGVTHTVRVCCFPSQQVKSAFGQLCISPDSFESWPHDFRTMLGWAFHPGDDELLLDLVAKGQGDAESWIASQVGLRAALALKTGGQSISESSLSSASVDDAVTVLLPGSANAHIVL